MQIVFQAHHAVIPDSLRERARRAVHVVASRISRAVEAVVRFEEDGPLRRVEIVVRCPRQRVLVAEGQARAFGVALSIAVARLRRQATAARHSRKATGSAADGDRAPAATGGLKRGGLASA